MLADKTGAEVAENYVGEASPKLPRPEKELKRFSKVDLRPGESQTVLLDGRPLPTMIPLRPSTRAHFILWLAVHLNRSTYAEL